MDKFTTLTGRAAPLPMTNVDTDMIIPKQHLKTIKRTGLGAALFEELRYHPGGAPREEFILNKDSHSDAKILIAGHNFGCGSSREHAPWALLDYGIRCIIAPSFADIFHNNCFKNGILPVVLPEEDVNILMEEAMDHEAGHFTVCLERQVVIRPRGNREVPFEVDEFGRHCLLNGLDHVELTLTKRTHIDTFESRQRLSQPWLHP